MGKILKSLVKFMEWHKIGNIVRLTIEEDNEIGICIYEREDGTPSTLEYIDGEWK